MTKREQVFALINEERARQEAAGLADMDQWMDVADWMCILMEEVGEAARAINQGDELGLLAEAVQVAAVAVAFVEAHLADEDGS